MAEEKGKDEKIKGSTTLLIVVIVIVIIILLFILFTRNTAPASTLPLAGPVGPIGGGC